MIHENHDLVFDNATTWHDYVNLYISMFYMMTHMKVFTLVLRIFIRGFTVMIT